MNVKFLEAREVCDGEGIVYARFKAGHVYELSTASARHWINRAAAVEVQGRAKPEVKPDIKSEEKAEAAEETVEVATAQVSPTSPKRGRGRPRSV